MSAGTGHNESRLCSRLAASVVLLFLCLSLWRLGDFGYGNDEQWLMKRGEMANRIVSDMWHGFWPAVENVVPSRGDWYLHPSFYAQLNYGGVAPLLRTVGLSEIPSYHFLNVVMASLLLWGLFLVARRLAGSRAALASVVLMALFPRFQAHAQYNPKEIPMVALVLLAVWAYLRFEAQRKNVFAALSGLFLGLALSVHLSSFVMIPVFVAAGLALFGFKKGLMATLIQLGVATCVLVLFWPLLWIDIGAVIQSARYFSSPFDTRNILFMGTVYQRNTLPWTYIPFYLFASSPLAWVILAGVGAVRAGIRGFIGTNKKMDLLLGWAFLPIVIKLVPGMVKYNGLRHAWIAVPPLIILAGMGFSYLTRRIKNKFSFAVTALILIGLPTVVNNVRLHPYQGEYFNGAVRLFVPENLNEKFEFPVWATPFKDAMEWINVHVPPDSTLRVPKSLNVFQMYPLRADLKISDKKQADYVVILGDDFKSLDQIGPHQDVFSINRMRSRILTVCKLNPSENIGE